MFQFAHTKQMGETGDHLLTSVQLNVRRMDLVFDAFSNKNALLPVTSKGSNNCNFQNYQISQDLIYFFLISVKFRDMFVDKDRYGQVRNAHKRVQAQTLAAFSWGQQSVFKVSLPVMGRYDFRAAAFS